MAHRTDREHHLEEAGLRLAALEAVLDRLALEPEPVDVATLLSLGALVRRARRLLEAAGWSEAAA